jgi:hypothetical protein
MTGINTEGFAVAGLRNEEGQMIATDDPRPYINSYQFVQYLLDTSASVQEAIDKARQLRIAHVLDSPDKRYNSHYMIADAKGGCAILEFRKRSDRRADLVVYGGQKPSSKFKAVLTNYLYRESLKNNPRNPDTRFQTGLKRFNRYRKSQDPIRYGLDTLDRMPYPSREGNMVHWQVAYDLLKRVIYFNTDDKKVNARARATQGDAYSANKKIRLGGLIPEVFEHLETRRSIPVNLKGPARDVTDLLSRSAYSTAENDRDVDRSVIWPMSRVRRAVEQVKAKGRD